MFDVGQEVVCINAKFGDGSSHGLTEGAHYHVAWVGMFLDLLCVRLVEVTRPFSIDPLIGILYKVTYNEDLPSDMPFLATRFAPILRQTTNISELQKLTKIRELEDA